jgi:hypothetical protein
VDFTEHLTEALIAAGFTPDERAWGTHEQCGTFALALYDLLVGQGHSPAIVAFGEDGNWRQGAVPEDLRYRWPGLVKRSHLNHITVRLEGRFFDIDGGHGAEEVASRYDANGMIELNRAMLRRKLGAASSQPLQFDSAFYSDIKRRLEQHLAAPDIRL